jgi:hypothetical protein
MDGSRIIASAAEKKIGFQKDLFPLERAVSACRRDQKFVQRITEKGFIIA